MNDFFERQERYAQLKKEADALNKTLLNELVELVNAVLIEEGCPLINGSQIKFYPQYIGNTGIGEPIDSSLTNIIYDNYFPVAPSGQYAHFTDLIALESILSKQKIRLTSTIKRKDDWEFKLFYDDLNVTGFERPYRGGTYDDYLMNELFYLSVTENKEVGIDLKRGMWNHFGHAGTGVKMIFEIETSHRDFRQVFYQNAKSMEGKSLLHKLNDRIESRFGKPFVFNSLSKIGSFYISKCFQDEFESRFLIKKDYIYKFRII